MHAFLTVFLLLAGMSGQDAEAAYQIEPVFKEQAVNWPSSIVRSSSGDLFVLDNNNHRILAFRSGKFLRQIGQIGQGESDLYQPSAMCLDKKDRLYVVDQENNRVQIFEPDGRPYGRFRADTHTNAIAVNLNGEILINNPNKGGLITAYSPRGKEAETWGSLVPLSRGYPGRRDADSMLVPLGRAYLLTDDSGIYIVFQFMPLVQKYSVSGDLLWETRLQGAPVEELVRTFWKEPGAKDPKSVRMFDRVQLTDIITSAAIAENGNLLAVLADRTICVLSPQGEQIRLLTLDPPLSGPFYGVGQYEGRLYFAAVRGLFRTKEPLDVTVP